MDPVLNKIKAAGLPEGIVKIRSRRSASGYILARVVRQRLHGPLFVTECDGKIHGMLSPEVELVVRHPFEEERLKGILTVVETFFEDVESDVGTGAR